MLVGCSSAAVGRRSVARGVARSYTLIYVPDAVAPCPRSQFSHMSGAAMAADCDMDPQRNPELIPGQHKNVRHAKRRHRNVRHVTQSKAEQCKHAPHDSCMRNCDSSAAPACLLSWITWRDEGRELSLKPHGAVDHTRYLLKHSLHL